MWRERRQGRTHSPLSLPLTLCSNTCTQHLPGTLSRQMMVKYTKIPSCEDTFGDKLEFFKYVTGRMAADKKTQQGKQGQGPAGSDKADVAATGQNGGFTVHAKAS